MTEIDRDRLTSDLRALGVPSRDVLVHASMRRIGPVAGGPSTVLGALRAAIGDLATIVVPTQTAGNSTTSLAYRRATRHLRDPDRIAAYQARMRGFDRFTTPSEGMGSLAEHVRRQPGAVRSAHPQTSFAALGPGAGALMAIHDLDCHLGERSPLGSLYAADASVVLLGVGYQACTAFHLAEYRLVRPPRRRLYRCFVDEYGTRVQYDFLAVDVHDRDFGKLGIDIDQELFVRGGRVGNGAARLVPMRALVDFAVEWLNVHRGDERTGPP